MTARDELLTAALALEGRGMFSFSPAELIAEARQGGSNYSDATLRSMIVHHMRVDEGRAKTGFERVGHGCYRLATEAGAGEGTSEPEIPSPVDTKGPPPPAAARLDADWQWEGNVQATLVRWLAASGWDILRVAGTASREQGVDIEARRGDESLVVEVKGYPSATYRSGTKQGETKSHGVGAQARTYFGNALLAGLLMRSDHPGAQVMLAFPDVTTFRSLAERAHAPLAHAGVGIWLVGEDGSVLSVSAS
jgi:hypothetical protein